MEWAMNEVQNENLSDGKALPEVEGKTPSAAVVNILDEALREISDDRVEVPETKTQPPETATKPLPLKIQDPIPAPPLRVEVPLPSSSTPISSAAPVAPSNVSVTTMPAQVFSGSQVTPLAGPVLGTPIMVTGVVIPRAPLPSNLISFVDASGNMQLAAVASPVLNPIHIRPSGVVVSTGSSTPSPIVVNPQPARPCVAPAPPPPPPQPRPVSAIVPVSTLPPVQPPIFKSTVRTIQPNKIVIKNITPPIKTEKEAAVSTQETSSGASSPCPAVTATKSNADSKPVVEKITIESKQQTSQADETTENSPRPLIELEAGIKLEGGVKLGETSRPEDEDKVNDVKYKILSVSTSQGVSKADELARTNLFKLVESESNVVITAPSTAVQDILDQLKKQFPDKKFVINYNSSKTASANLKNLVQGVKDGVAAAERALKRADAENPAGQPTPAKRRKATTKKAQAEPPAPKNPVSYRSARLRGEKAPDLFEGSRKSKVEPKSTSSPARPPKVPGRTRGRPRKVRVDNNEDPSATRINAPECLQKMQDVAMLGEEDSTASSGASSGQSNEYNAEIRVGEEYQAVLTDYCSIPPPEDYDEKADLIYHPEQGLLESNRQDGAKAASDMPLYDFVEWTSQEKRIFKKYLGGYKTKFFKYLSVLPNKRLLDVIDHYYSTHSPARDYVLPKKSKHYYLVSKNKQIVAPKGVFGIINEKRKVVPNRKFCANSNIVLYEDALPTRKPRENAARKEREKPATNGKPSKIVKFEDVMKPMPNNNGQKTKKGTEAVSSVSSAENSENESELSTEDDVLNYGMRKHRPGTDFGEDIKELISKESVNEIATLDEDLEKLKEELTSMKNTYTRNKAEAVQMEAEMRKIAKSVDGVNKAIGKARKITETWSEEDRLLTIQAFRTYGKDFKAVSKLVGTKSEQAIRYFYETNAQRYGLDTPIATSSEEPAVVSAQPPASPSKPTPPDSPARGPRPMPSILRRKIAMKPLKS